MKKEIACIILNYNNYEDTIKCVDNILKMNCMVDIVIPDNNSNNDSCCVLEKKYKDEKRDYFEDIIKHIKIGDYKSIKIL